MFQFQGNTETNKICYWCKSYDRWKVFLIHQGCVFYFCNSMCRDLWHRQLVFNEHMLSIELEHAEETLIKLINNNDI